MVIIRLATEDDLPQVRTINTHYILHTSLTFAQYPPPLESYSTTYSQNLARGLPYLVAVDEVQLSQDGTTLVLGYAYLSPYRGDRLSYAPTVELTLFVHPDYQSQSIGSRLLSALLEKVHRGEVRNRASEITSRDDCIENSHGGHDSVAGVPVRNILAVMSVDLDGKDEGDALRRWYIQRGFVERGRLEKIGCKWDRWIDTIYLQYRVPE
ncbi:hypothetical protein BDV59DRAFT_202904 [Aspergillus ambiguus]|uniref:GNAT family N-acetyltransferase n=1 Tax=Aspergillus ambiguus TaxID=176160 RepID=UPI003CCCA2DD